MRGLILILAIALLAGCRKKRAHQYTAGQLDTIRRASFYRLNENEAYNFINNYYLPHLDTLRTKRKIFIHPLKSRDILGEYLKSINNPQKGVILAPQDFGVDSAFNWDQKKLKTVHVVTGKELDEIAQSHKLHSGYDPAYSARWHQKMGYGYVCISYPMYNPYTKRLFFNEWVEDNSFCGTGRDQNFWYLKVGNKWVIQ